MQLSAADALIGIPSETAGSDAAVFSGQFRIGSASPTHSVAEAKAKQTGATAHEFSPKKILVVASY